MAATVVGGSMIIMQLAAHKGYIKVGPFSLLFFDLERNVNTLCELIVLIGCTFFFLYPPLLLMF